LFDKAWRGFAEDFARRRQRKLEQMDGYFRNLMDDLLNYLLVRPWRESLDLFKSTTGSRWACARPRRIPITH
jgi:hypothetical protein